MARARRVLARKRSAVGWKGQANQTALASGVIRRNRDPLRVVERRQSEWKSGLTATYAVCNQDCRTRSHGGTSALQKILALWRNVICGLEKINTVPSREINDPLHRR